MREALALKGSSIFCPYSFVYYIYIIFAFVSFLFMASCIGTSMVDFESSWTALLGTCKIPAFKPFLAKLDWMNMSELSFASRWKSLINSAQK